MARDCILYSIEQWSRLYSDSSNKCMSLVVYMLLQSVVFYVEHQLSPDSRLSEPLISRYKVTRWHTYWLWQKYNISNITVVRPGRLNRKLKVWLGKILPGILSKDSYWDMGWRNVLYYLFLMWWRSMSIWHIIATDWNCLWDLNLCFWWFELERKVSEWWVLLIWKDFCQWVTVFNIS